MAACSIGEPFLVVSELMKEGNLHNWVIKNNAESPELLNDMAVLVGLMREVSTGLLHLHQQGIIHRDIKPENILLCKDEQTYTLHAKLAGVFFPSFES